MDLVILSRLMGHTTISMIVRYVKQTHADLMDKYQSIVDD